MRPRRDHTFTWCIPISLGQFHTDRPASNTVFFPQNYVGDLLFCSAPPEPQIHLVHPHQPGPPSEQNRFFIVTVAICFSVWPRRDHRFIWCVPISPGQLHTVLPASKTEFSDTLTGTTDSPGASPSAWASSTQTFKRATPLFHIHFHVFAVRPHRNH